MDSLGGVGGSYIQYCNGYPVEGAQMNVISKYGVVLFATGHMLPNLNTDVTDAITDSTALDSALAYVNAPKYAWEDIDLENSLKYKLDTGLNDTIFNQNVTYYPKGELVIARLPLLYSQLLSRASLLI